jgi:hypothetical protein
MHHRLLAECTHLLKEMLSVHKTEEGVVGGISHDSPGIPP